MDFAIDPKLSRNLSSYDAIYEACLLRFRPVMMTTTAAIADAIPLALSFSRGAEVRRPPGSRSSAVLCSRLLNSLHHARSLFLHGSGRPVVFSPAMAALSRIYWTKGGGTVAASLDDAHRPHRSIRRPLALAESRQQSPARW